MTRTHSNPHTVQTDRPAFTIIEVLVVIGIIGVLISILLPTLGGARIAARETLSLTNARSIGMSFDAYAESEGTYPFPGMIEDQNAPDREDTWSLYWFPEITIIATTNIWSMDTLWPGLVSSSEPWEERFPMWVSPGGDTELPTHEDLNMFGNDAGWRIGYEYSNSFLGSPRLWAEGSAADDALLRPTAPHQVTFPSSKVLLFDRHLWYRTKRPEIRLGHYDAPAPMAFADGHAAVHNPLDAKAGAENPMNSGDTRTIHNTPNGVDGVDF